MKTLKILLLVLVAFTTTAFGQVLHTKTMYNSFTNDIVEMSHSFNMSFGENKDITWFHNNQFNDTFKRVSDFETGFTKHGEFYRAAEYVDGKGVHVMIQYFPHVSAVRVLYFHNRRILEFFQ
jgi:hypothetical protein